jgi:hypothetical protein
MASRPSSRLNLGANLHPRRNLFNAGALRRPASSSTSTTTTTTTILDSPQVSESDIIVRRPDGRYTVAIPNVAPPDNDMVANDEEEISEGKQIRSYIRKLTNV